MNESLSLTYDKLKGEPQALPYYEKFRRHHPVTADEILREWDTHKLLTGKTIPHYLGFGMNGFATIVSFLIIAFAIIVIWRCCRAGNRRDYGDESHEMQSTNN